MHRAQSCDQSFERRITIFWKESSELHLIWEVLLYVVIVVFLIFNAFVILSVPTLQLTVSTMTLPWELIKPKRFVFKRAVCNIILPQDVAVLVSLPCYRLFTECQEWEGGGGDFTCKNSKFRGCLLNAESLLVLFFSFLNIAINIVPWE